MDNPKMMDMIKEERDAHCDSVCSPESISVEKFLEQMDAYIVGSVIKEMRGNSFRADPAVLDLEIDEVSQRIRIKFWQAWEKRHIEKPMAYLKRIIHNEIAEFARTYEPSIPLPLDEHGELYQGQMMLVFDKSIRDPLEMQYPEAWELMTKKNILAIVKTILYFSEQQRYALLYKLNLVVDDIFYLKEILQGLKIDLQQIVWPQTLQERQRMRASYFIAKRALAKILGNEREDRIKNAIEWVSRIERWQSLPTIDLTAKEKSESTQEITEMFSYIKDLREPYQTVLRLHYLEHRSYSTISVSLNLSIGTVKARVKRGLEGLHQLAEGKATKRFVKPTEEELLGRSELLSRIKSCVSDLKEPYQTSVRLRYAEGKSCAEIAMQLNLPLSTIKTRVSRGLRILGIRLSD